MILLAVQHHQHYSLVSADTVSGISIGNASGGSGSGSEALATATIAAGEQPISAVASTGAESCVVVGGSCGSNEDTDTVQTLAIPVGTAVHSFSVPTIELDAATGMVQGGIAAWCPRAANPSAASTACSFPTAQSWFNYTTAAAGGEAGGADAGASSFAEDATIFYLYAGSSSTIDNHQVCMFC